MRRPADAPKATRSQLRAAVARAQHSGLHFYDCVQRGRCKNARARARAHRDPRCLREARGVLSSFLSQSRTRCQTRMRIYAQRKTFPRHVHRQAERNNRLTVIACRLPTVASGVARRRHPESLHVSASPPGAVPAPASRGWGRRGRSVESAGSITRDDTRCERIGTFAYALVIHRREITGRYSTLLCASLATGSALSSRETRRRSGGKGSDWSRSDGRGRARVWGKRGGRGGGARSPLSWRKETAGLFIYSRTPCELALSLRPSKVCIPFIPECTAYYLEFFKWAYRKGKRKCRKTGKRVNKRRERRNDIKNEIKRKNDLFYPPMKF